MAYIDRAISDILKKRVGSSKCLLLTGARQVGKSTLIKHEFPDYIRVSFDDKMTRLQAKEEPKLFFLNNPRPLFIDEVQKENRIQRNLKMGYLNCEQSSDLIYHAYCIFMIKKGWYYLQTDL